MARLAMRKIENRRNLHVTFTKRRKGLIKKAYELSILCDIDIALITYSPSGRPFLFSGKKRIEDVIARYINHLHEDYPPNPLCFFHSDDGSNSKHNSPTTDSSDAKELKQEIDRLQYLLQAAKERLRMYAGGPVEKASTVEMASCERDLLDILTRVRQRKEYLLNNFLSSSYDISTTNIPTSIGNEFESQFPDYAKAIDASAASNPLLDILQEFDPSKMYYVPPDTPQDSTPFPFQSFENMGIQNEQLPLLAVNDEGEIYERMSSNQ